MARYLCSIALIHQEFGHFGRRKSCEVKDPGLVRSQDFHWMGAARAEDAQWTPIQSPVSPGILAYEETEELERAHQDVGDH